VYIEKLKGVAMTRIIVEIDVLPPEKDEPTHRRKMDPPYRYFVTKKTPV
jgi:hypothetical protein